MLTCYFYHPQSHIQGRSRSALLLQIQHAPSGNPLLPILQYIQNTQLNFVPDSRPTAARAALPTSYSIGGVPSGPRTSRACATLDTSASRWSSGLAGHAFLELIHGFLVAKRPSKLDHVTQSAEDRPRLVVSSRSFGTGGKKGTSAFHTTHASRTFLSAHFAKTRR